MSKKYYPNTMQPLKQIFLKQGGSSSTVFTKDILKNLSEA